MAGERILICDDGRENRDFIIEYIIQPSEFEVITARNGLEAMEVLRSDEPLDLVLLDLQMPKMSGMEVLEAMRAEDITVPVVLMTFHGSEEIAIEVYRKGVKDYVKKPFSVEEMSGAIERALSEVRLRQEKERLTERLILANTEMNQRIRELNMLYRVGKSVTALTSLDELLPRILRAAVEITDSEAGSLFLAQGDQLIGRAIKYPGEPQIHRLNQALDNPFARRAVQTGKPLILNQYEMQELRRDNAQADLPFSVLVTPMVVGERVIGALLASNVSDATQPFRKQDGAMLSALSDYAAIAIENARNFSEVTRYQQQSGDTTTAPAHAKSFFGMIAFIRIDLANVDAPPAQKHDLQMLRISALIEQFATTDAYVYHVLGHHLIAVWDLHMLKGLEALKQLLRISEKNEDLQLTIHAGDVEIAEAGGTLTDVGSDAVDKGMRLHLAIKNESIVLSKVALKYFEVDEISVEPLNDLPAVRFLNII